MEREVYLPEVRRGVLKLRVCGYCGRRVRYEILVGAGGELSSVGAICGRCSETRNLASAKTEELPVQLPADDLQPQLRRPSPEMPGGERSTEPEL